MSDRSDYLLDPRRFDPRSPVDAEIAALEKALAPLALRDGVLRPPVFVPRREWPRYVGAALVLLGIVLAFALVRREAPLAPFAPPRTFVAADRPLRVSLGELAQIELRSGGELTFERWDADQVVFTLRRGSVEARVAPPPVVPAGFFRLDTKFGRVRDQGGRWELALRDDGSARLVVAEGAVAFDTEPRTVFVPAGAAVVVTSRGVATPTFRDADAELVKATMEFDAARDTAAPLGRRFMALKMVLAAARTKRDSLVLWHLLRDPEPEIRKVAEAELVQRFDGGPVGKGMKAGGADPDEWLAFLRTEVWH